MGRSRILVIDDEPEIRNTIANILVMDRLERIGRNPFGQTLYEHVRQDYTKSCRSRCAAGDEAAASCPRHWACLGEPTPVP